METFAIKIIDKNISEFCGVPCCQGEIQIKKFKETFSMPLHLWSVKDYKKQWKEGIKRIKRHDISCLVVSMQNYNKIPLAEIWVFYKEGNKVYIQNHLLVDEIILEILKKKSFNLKTCYDFISPRRTVSSDGMKISEWEISLEAIISAKILGSNAKLGSTESDSPQFDYEGRLVFTNGQNWITQNQNIYQDGRWKMLNNKCKRLGTFDETLEIMVGK